MFLSNHVNTALMWRRNPLQLCCKSVYLHSGYCWESAQDASCCFQEIQRESIFAANQSLLARDVIRSEIESRPCGQWCGQWESPSLAFRACRCYGAFGPSISWSEIRTRNTGSSGLCSAGCRQDESERQTYSFLLTTPWPWLRGELARLARAREFLAYF